MHGYSYARNTPVTVPDPTGLRVCLEACFSDDDDQAMAVRKENDHTRRHDAARDWAAAMIAVQVALSGGDPTKVTIEMNVPGGSKTKGSTADGSADIAYVDEKAGVVYVWEVKKGTVGSTSAGRDIQTCRPYMAKDPRFRGMDIRPGFSLAVPPSGVVVPSPHPNEALRIYNGTQPGAILYDVVASPPPPGPVHVRVPDRVPVPVPAPHPRPVPYAAPTPPQAPTPAPLHTPFIPLHPGGIPPELVVALVTFGVVIIGACIAAAPVCIGGVALGGGAAAVATS